MLVMNASTSVGAIKIKDGLFMGDEFAAQVCPALSHTRSVGSRVLHCEQGELRDQLLRQAGP